MKAQIIMLLLSSTILAASAQEQLGLRLGNYSGIQSMQLNPAWQVNGPLKWDVNIVAGGAFAHQDYLYGQKGNMLRLLRNGGEIVTTPADGNGDGGTTSNGVPFYFQDNRNYDFQHTAFAMAPSFMVNLREHSFGAYFTGRTFTSGYQLDGELNYFNLADSNLFVGNIEPFQIGAMAWGEAGFTYARTVRKGRKAVLNAGATLKLLVGFDAMSIRNTSTTSVTRMDDAVALGPTELEIAYATGYDNENGYRFQRHGFGAAADIGFTWVAPENRMGNRPYKWKVGVSLLDVGRLRYQKDAAVYQYSSADTSLFTTEMFQDVRDADDFIDAINNSGNAAQAEQSGGQFGMWAPMALSVQFDAPVYKKLFVSGTAVVGMRFKGNAVERSDLLAVTPRFEHRWVEFGIPLSVYRWKEMNLGTYLRLGPITIGTESLNSWFLPGRLEGSDIYFALKIHSGMFKKTKRDTGGSGCYSNSY